MDSNDVNGGKDNGCDGSTNKSMLWLDYKGNNGGMGGSNCDGGIVGSCVYGCSGDGGGKDGNDNYGCGVTCGRYSCDGGV